MRIGLITGASSGLGEEFTRQIAGLKNQAGLDELWLVARRGDRLQEVADGLPLVCRCFSLDLGQAGALDVLGRELAEKKLEVAYLVNCAGIASQGPFEKQNSDDLVQCLRVNNLALVQLTHLVKPYLVRGSKVLQIASVSAFLPQPNYATYAASKTFVLHFSRALRAEWKPEGIKVLAVCPNLMATDFIGKAKMSGESLRVKKLGLEKPDKVVAHALRAADRGKAVSVSSWPGRFLHLVSKVLPHGFILWLEKKLHMY